MARKRYIQKKLAREGEEKSIAATSSFNKSYKRGKHRAAGSWRWLRTKEDAIRT